MAKTRHIKLWSAAVVLVVIAGLVAWRIEAILAGPSHQYAGRGAQGGRMLALDAVRAERRSVPYVISASGTAETEHSVAVRAQVGGTLQRVLFDEGDEVKAGQLLFVIDPEPYRIAVAQNTGQVEQDEAKLAADKANAERMANLVKSGYVSTQDDENAAALVKQDEGTLASDKAKLAQASLQLGYTQIRAPISGKTGALAFKSGNLVQANGTTALVTINEIAPILVQFDIPQSQLPPLMKNLEDPALNVAVRGPDGNLVEGDGKLVFMDNTINPDSGTLSLKAEFSNAKRLLWPGELVTVELTLAIEKDAVVIPAIAVQPGQNTGYVYTIEKGKVQVHDVEVAREFGGLAVIAKGISPGDVVIFHVPRELREGMSAKAKLLPFPSTTQTAAAATA